MEIYVFTPKLYCIYHFPIDLEPNAILLGSKSIEKVQSQSIFVLIAHDSEKIFVLFHILLNNKIKYFMLAVNPMHNGL